MSNGWIRLLPIGCHVNVILLPHEGHLLTAEPSESKHPNLLNDVSPISRCSCVMSTIVTSFVGPGALKRKNKNGKQKSNKSMYDQKTLCDLPQSCMPYSLFNSEKSRKKLLAYYLKVGLCGFHCRQVKWFLLQ
jgi:hypothetical protein